MSDKKQSLFDKLYDGSKEMIKAMKKPLAIKALQRKFSAGIDSTEDSIDKANARINEEIMKGVDANLQKCIDEKAKIRNARESQEDLKDLYKELFDEEYTD